MRWLEQARYWMAVLFVISMPPALAWWLIIHPFVAFWRRLGKAATFTIIWSFYFGSMFGLFFLREFFLGRDLGFQPWMAGAGAVVFLLSSAIAMQRKRYLKMRILGGVPEINPADEMNRLLKEGIYARIRHPRYVEFLVGSLGWALVLNYAGVWIMYVISVTGILLIVPLEEKELRDRFGQEYVDYCARVPRFIPRFGKPGIVR